MMDSMLVRQTIPRTQRSLVYYFICTATNHTSI